MNITFIKDYVVQQWDGKGPVYRAGETKDFVGISAETYARKYVRLGVAKEYEAPAPVVQPTVKPEQELVAEQLAEESPPENEDQPAGNRRPSRNHR